MCMLFCTCTFFFFFPEPVQVCVWGHSEGVRGEPGHATEVHAVQVWLRGNVSFHQHVTKLHLRIPRTSTTAEPWRSVLNKTLVYHTVVSGCAFFLRDIYLRAFSTMSQEKINFFDSDSYVLDVLLLSRGALMLCRAWEINHQALGYIQSVRSFG